MPSVSKKQHNLMAMVANDPAASKRLGIPQSVGKEFTEADKGKKIGSATRADSQVANQSKTNHGKQAVFKQGGEIMKKMDLKQDKAMVKKAVGMHDKQQHMGKKTDLAMLKKGGGVKKMASGGMASMGSVRTAAPSKDGVASKGKTKGSKIVMAGNKGMKSGGMAKKYC